MPSPCPHRRPPSLPDLRAVGALPLHTAPSPRPPAPAQRKRARAAMRQTPQGPLLRALPRRAAGRRTRPASLGRAPQRWTSHVAASMADAARDRP
eukprot:230955-Chlamydomonas_euryale.AAC.5